MWKKIERFKEDIKTFLLILVFSVVGCSAFIGVLLFICFAFECFKVKPIIVYDKSKTTQIVCPHCGKLAAEVKVIEGKNVEKD